jgi:hypothetical protein
MNPPVKTKGRLDPHLVLAAISDINGDGRYMFEAERLIEDGWSRVFLEPLTESVSARRITHLSKPVTGPGARLWAVWGLGLLRSIAERYGLEPPEYLMEPNRQACALSEVICAYLEQRQPNPRAWR